MTARGSIDRENQGITLIRGFETPSGILAGFQSTLNIESRKMERGSENTIIDIPKEQCIVLTTAKGISASINKEYLLETISNKIEEGKVLTEIIIEAYNDEGFPVEIKLTDEIWKEKLITNFEKELLPLWQAHLNATQSRNNTILSLIRSDPNFV